MCPALRLCKRVGEIIEHDKETLDKLVKYLQSTVYAGVIFTRDGSEGTFKLADAGIDAPEAADVIMSFRWRLSNN